MLVAHLFESDDDLPLLARIIQARLDKRQEVFIYAKLSNGANVTFGEIVKIYIGSPFKMLGRNGQPLEVPRLFIRWKNITRPGGKEEWVRADTFDDRFTFEKDEEGDWMLRRRIDAAE